MNDPSQSQSLNHMPPSQSVNPPLVMNQQQVLSQTQIMSQSQMMSQPQMLNQSQLICHPPIMNPPQVLSQPLMLNRGYGMWGSQAVMDSGAFPNHPNLGFLPSKVSNKPGRINWKGKNASSKLKDARRTEKPTTHAGGGSSTGAYNPPTLHELQSQNRLKARKFYPKRKFNSRFAPFAPRNTTSFIIRAKKSGGIASLVSPCPVTPAVLPTPIFSPSREVLVDMAKEEWGVDGYGSMKGLIRLRSPTQDEYEDEQGGGGSSESDVEEHVEVERRLSHDLSRFEMIYPNYTGETSNVLENRVDDQDTHIAQLEEENLTLKERLFLMERELGDLKIRLQCLERKNQVLEDISEEVVMGNGSEDEEEEDIESVQRTEEEEEDEGVEEEDAGTVPVEEDRVVVKEEISNEGSVTYPVNESLNL